MIFRVVNQSVVGEDNPLGPPASGSQGVDVALGIGPAFGLGKQAFIVPEAVPADAHARGPGLQGAAGPPQVPMSIT